MDVEHLYLIIGFLLGVLLTGCIFIAAIMIYYDWVTDSEKDD